MQFWRNRHKETQDIEKKGQRELGPKKPLDILVSSSDVKIEDFCESKNPKESKFEEKKSFNENNLITCSKETGMEKIQNQIKKRFQQKKFKGIKIMINQQNSFVNLQL
jgi:hypothetical protein